MLVGLAGTSAGAQDDATRTHPNVYRVQLENDWVRIIHVSVPVYAHDGASGAVRGRQSPRDLAAEWLRDMADVARALPYLDRRHPRLESVTFRVLIGLKWQACPSRYTAGAVEEIARPLRRIGGLAAREALQRRAQCVDGAGRDGVDADAVGGVVDGEDVLPGFRLPIADLFREWDWD